MMYHQVIALATPNAKSVTLTYILQSPLIHHWSYVAPPPSPANNPSCMPQSVQGSGEWCESLTTYIRNNDVSLAESSEKIISTYESELLPCESLSEMIDVIGM